jgi:hypothetical protein
MQAQVVRPWWLTGRPGSDLSECVACWPVTGLVKLNFDFFF